MSQYVDNNVATLVGCKSGDVGSKVFPQHENIKPLVSSVWYKQQPEIAGLC